MVFIVTVWLPADWGVADCRAEAAGGGAGVVMVFTDARLRTKHSGLISAYFY